MKKIALIALAGCAKTEKKAALDPFAGTGTTALAAMECGRNSISVDVEPKYIKLIQKRLDAAPLSATIDYYTTPPARVEKAARSA